MIASTPLPELLALLSVVVREGISVIALATALSCVDDLLVDAVFFVRRGWREATVRRRAPPLRACDLGDRPQPRIAILVPAWDEAAVVGDMLRHVAEQKIGTKNRGRCPAVST